MEEELKQKIRDLFAEQRVAVLATAMDGTPYTTLVGFISSADLKELFLATTRATRKFVAISANPRVAMLIDSRSNRAEDFRDAIAVTAMGDAHEVDKAEYAETLGRYLSKHPHLSEFVSSPTCAFVRVSVDVYNVVTRFQHVTVIHMNR